MEVYLVRIMEINEEMLNKICLLVSLEKKHRIQKFFNKKDKVRTLIADVLLRMIIIDKLNIRNEEIIFEKNQYGKPYLKNYPYFNFNISHSGDYVICGISNEAIGCDIEKVKEIEVEEIAKRFFSKKELSFITKNNLNNQLNIFYEIWTLKESYIKCRGFGLYLPLKSFSIDINKCKDIKVFSSNGYKEKYSFKKFDINQVYKLAICSEGKDISSNIIEIDQNSLLNRFCILCFK